MPERGYSRREFLAGVGGVALISRSWQEGQTRPPSPPGQPRLPGQDSLVGELMDPARAGKLRGRVTEYENDPFVVGIEEKLRCTCGCNLSVYTCRTTDFTCETSPAMHRRVVELVEQKKSAQEILDAFVAQYGESVLMAPPRAGFNLAGYLVPGILITLVGGALAVVIVRQTRARAVTAAAKGGRGGPDGPAGLGEPDLSSTLPPDEQARIKAELEKLGI
ncbi:MAG: cytochrome c-type biogenesis protein CcmH [Gemmatimonadetes bacterium]|nr:cytochrome c-type biogenesis protein CcmH [Gemmatimonadota bacterium]